MWMEISSHHDLMLCKAAAKTSHFESDHLSGMAFPSSAIRRAHDCMTQWLRGKD